MHNIRLEVDIHIPRGSGDAEYHLIDIASDNHDVLAVVDPDMMMDEPATFAERLRDSFNNTPLFAVLKSPPGLHRAFYHVVRLVTVGAKTYALRLDPSKGGAVADPAAGWRCYDRKDEAFKAARGLGKTLPTLYGEVGGHTMSEVSPVQGVAR